MTKIVGTTHEADEESLIEYPSCNETNLSIRESPNAAHHRRADAANAEHIYPDRALAACACMFRIGHSAG